MCKKVTNADYKQFLEELRKTPWVYGELDFLNRFVVTTDREITLQQVYELNRIYKTRLSRGYSKAPDECGELAEYIVSNDFQDRIHTNDRDTAIALVNDLGRAAKARGRFLLSFTSKYCHHCNPNQFPIYDSVNVKFLKERYDYKDKKDYRTYLEFYDKFLQDIEVDLEHTSNPKEGFLVDKFINNI